MDWYNSIFDPLRVTVFLTVRRYGNNKKIEMGGAYSRKGRKLKFSKQNIILKAEGKGG
jgi:hypothetical protein